LLGDGQISMLPRGVDEYLERRAVSSGAPHPADLSVPAAQGPPTRHFSSPDPARPVTSGAGSGAGPAKAKSGSAEERTARKNVARIDKRLARITARETELNAAVLDQAQDYEKLAELSAELHALAAEKEQLELEWLEAAELLE
jgi:ATP-binding cassette subfamily F protein uup